MVDADIGRARRIGHVRHHADHRPAGGLRCGDGRDIGRMLLAIDYNAVGTAAEDARRDGSRITHVENGALDDDRAVQRFRNLAHRAGQAFHEGGDGTGEDSLDAQLPPVRAGQDAAQAERLGRCDDAAFRLGRDAAALVQHPVDGRKADAGPPRDLGKPRAPFSSLHGFPCLFRHSSGMRGIPQSSGSAPRAPGL